jgi:hypothetical protein
MRIFYISATAGILLIAFLASLELCLGAKEGGGLVQHRRGGDWSAGASRGLASSSVKDAMSTGWVSILSLAGGSDLVVVTNGAGDTGCGTGEEHESIGGSNLGTFFK